MHTELISVILCTRDRDSLADHVIESISKQTYIHRELIVEEGVGNNNVMRNLGFSKSKGEFVFFMDEDIVLHPDCLLLLYEQLIKCSVDFTYCNYDRIGELTGIQRGRNFDVEQLRRMNYISTMSLMRRSVFPGFDPNIRRLQDWSLFLTVCENGGTGAWVDECLFTAIYREGSISIRGCEDWLRSVDIVKNKHNIIS